MYLFKEFYLILKNLNNFGFMAKLFQIKIIRRNKNNKKNIKLKLWLNIISIFNVLNKKFHNILKKYLIMLKKDVFNKLQKF